MWFGVVLLAAACVPLLYALLYLVIFHWFGQVSALAPNEGSLYVFDWRSSDQTTVRRVSSVRQPVLLHRVAWIDLAEEVFLPLVFAELSHQGGEVSPAEQQRVQARLVELRATAGQGVLFITGDEIRLTKRTGLWSMGGTKTVPNPETMTPGTAR